MASPIWAIRESMRELKRVPGVPRHYRGQIRAAIRQKLGHGSQTVLDVGADGVRTLGKGLRGLVGRGPEQGFGLC